MESKRNNFDKIASLNIRSIVFAQLTFLFSFQNVLKKVKYIFWCSLNPFPKKMKKKYLKSFCLKISFIVYNGWRNNLKNQDMYSFVPIFLGGVGGVGGGWGRGVFMQNISYFSFHAGPSYFCEKVHLQNFFN